MKIIDKSKGEFLRFLNPLTGKWEWDSINLENVSDEDLVVTYHDCIQGMEDYFEYSPDWDFYRQTLEHITPEYQKRNIQYKYDDTIVYYID